MSLKDLQSRPQLVSYAELKTDPISGNPILLFPEGLLILNSTASEILCLCNGKNTIQDILQQLAEDYDVPADTLKEDVSQNLDQLLKRNLLIWK